MPSSKVVVDRELIHTVLSSLAQIVIDIRKDKADDRTVALAESQAQDLRAALQQEGEVRAGQQFRLVADVSGDDPGQVGAALENLADARIALSEFNPVGAFFVYHNPRLQFRQTFTGPWVHLNDQEGEQ